MSGLHRSACPTEATSHVPPCCKVPHTNDLYWILSRLHRIWVSITKSSWKWFSHASWGKTIANKWLLLRFSQCVSLGSLVVPWTDLTAKTGPKVVVKFSTSSKCCQAGHKYTRFVLSFNKLCKCEKHSSSTGIAVCIWQSTSEVMSKTEGRASLSRSISYGYVQTHTLLTYKSASKQNNSAGRITTNSIRFPQQ